jgi:subtilisin-like proprotein convertase family protein
VPGTDSTAIAAAVGAESAEPAPGAPGWHLFRAGGLAAAPDLADRLAALGGVAEVQVQFGRQPRKKLIPNDTYFPNQWHLRNTGQGGGTAGVDVNVASVWDVYRGTHVVIGIVDDGLETTHPDLASNVNTAWDRDWNDTTPLDPSPDPANEDFHGTSCAGVAAARGNNSIGVSGAAPEATLVGLRLIAGIVDDADEADALTHSNAVIHIKSNSWGPDDDGLTLEGPGALTRAALSNGTAHGRGGLGTLYTWAGGNGLEANDNANKDGYANSPYTIAVGAVDDDGAQAYYSEPGACLVVAAPSSGGATDITTTDLVGTDGYNSTYGTAGEPSNRDYTGTFGGTSSATPLVAGVVALVLQANPALGWRDVQEILIRSARRINPTDAGWATNSEGLAFNNKFGAGMVNASGAVARALSWTNLGPRISLRAAQSGLGLSIPDNSTTGVSRALNVTTNLRVEHVEVTLDVSHTSRGHLEVVLISPAGMQSRLIEKHSDSGDNYRSWTFTSVRHWGEFSQGAWTVRVADRTSGTIGTLNSVILSVHGTAAGPAPRRPPLFESVPSPTVESGEPVSVTVAALPTDGDAVSLSSRNLPAWATFVSTNEIGIMSGTPGEGDAGVWTVFFDATDIDGTVSATSRVTVTAGGTAETNVLAGYTFDQDGSFTTNPASTAAGMTASGFRTRDGTLTTFGGMTGASVADSGWTGTVHYFEFTVVPDAGRDIQVTALQFGDRRSSSGPTAWRVTSGADGHAATLASGTTHSSWMTNAAVFAPFVSTAPLSIRIHGSGASASSGTWRLDDVRLLGRVRSTATDSDGDGITDDWELRYSGTSTGLVALSDADVDGFTALQEFLADTHPGVASSRFEVAQMVVDGAVARIGFLSSTGRLYSIHLLTNLVDASGWRAVITDRPGSNGVTTLWHTNPAPLKLYRVNVRRP